MFTERVTVPPTDAATEADVVQTTFLEDELLSFGLDPKLSASRILTSAAEDSGFDSSTRTEDPEAGVMSPPCQSPLPKMDVFDKISADEDLDYEALKHLLEIVHAPASDAAVNTIDEAGTTQGATATDNRAPDDATFNNVAPTMGGSDKGLPLTFPGTLFSPEKLIFPVISSANSHHIDAPLAAGSCTASANEEPPATAAAGGGAAVCLMEGGEVAEENPSMVLMAVIQDLQTSRNKSKKPRTNAQQESHKMEERRRRKRICDAKNRLHAVIEDKMVRQNKSELNVVMNAIVYLLQLQKSLSSDREEIEDLGKRIQATMQNLQELFPNRK